MNRNLAIALCFALAAAPLAAAAASAAAIPAAVAERLKDAARKAEPKGAEEKHPVLALDLGALGPAALALYAREDQSTYSGVVAMAGPAGSGPVRTVALPPVEEIEGRFEMTPTAVFTTPDAGGRKALVVLYSYYINGSGQPEDNAGYVYAWDGRAWRIDEARTPRLAGVKSAKAARAKLGG
ncbi:MAG TPA: hypothetical protein VG939_06410 [Caulobacteraceae bacterium]|nr:hypothetical protein [Caulobacteraceae bacterium]